MENKTNPRELKIKDIIDIIFRNKMIIIITFITIIIFTLIGLQFITPVYDANVKMLIRGQGITAADTYVPIGAFEIHSTQAEIVQSKPVLRQATIALGLQNRPLDYEKNFCSSLKKLYIYYMSKKAEKYLNKLTLEKQQEIKLEMAIDNLKSRLSVNLLPSTDIFVINVTGFTPEEAIEAANVISRSYTIFDQLQQLAEITIRYGEFHPTVLQLQDNIKYATENLSGKTLPDIQAMGTASVKVIEQASSNNLPISKPKRVILAGAFIIAAFMGLALAFAYGFFIDQTIKSPQEIVTYLDMPCIGSIPRKKRKENFLITEESPLTLYEEYYEDLAEQLYIFLKTQGLKSALITSPAFNDNHQFIVPNIGYLFSQIMGHNTLLIDVNFNTPHFQEIYRMQNKEAITYDAGLDKPQNLIHKTDDGPDILLTDKFTDKPSAIIKKIDLKIIINQLKKEYDVILIDATSVNNIKDISFISECCDGTVIIIDEGKLQKQMIKNSLPRLRHKDIKIIGSILNNRTFPIPEFIYKKFKYFID